MQPAHLRLAPMAADTAARDAPHPQRLGDGHSPQLGQGLILLIPLGSTEQHGPHLPLDTDTRIAVALAEAAAARLGPPVLIAPAVPYGSAGEHAGFPGSLSIGQEALELLLVELVRSCGPEVDRVVIVNGHGGNVEPLRRALTTLQEEGRAASVWSATVPGGDAHAGRTETSLMLFLAPHLVAGPGPQGNTAPLADLLPKLRLGGVKAVASNGVLGDPAGASAAEGEALFANLVGRLCTAIDRPAIVPGVTSPSKEETS